MLAHQFSERDIRLPEDIRAGERTQTPPLVSRQPAKPRLRLEFSSIAYENQRRPPESAAARKCRPYYIGRRAGDHAPLLQGPQREAHGNTVIRICSRSRVQLPYCRKLGVASTRTTWEMARGMEVERRRYFLRHAESGKITVSKITPSVVSSPNRAARSRRR